MKPDLISYYQNLKEREFLLVGRFILLIWLIKVLFFDTCLAAAYPDSLLVPTGLFQLLSEELMFFFFTQQALTGLKVLIVIVLGAFILKPGNRWLGLGAVILLLVFSNVNHSFGSYINHAEVALCVTTIIFVIALFVKNATKSTNYELHIPFFFSLSAIVLTILYTQIGVYRLVHGGLALYFSEYMEMIVLERSLQRVDHYFSLGTIFVTHEWFKTLLKTGFILTTFFEISSPITLFFKRFRQVWLVVLIPFHISTLLLMNIFFWENVLLMLILFTGLLRTYTSYLDKKSLAGTRNVSGKALQKCGW